MFNNIYETQVSKTSFSSTFFYHSSLCKRLLPGKLTVVQLTDTFRVFNATENLICNQLIQM
jgi:hypothetical protein